MDDWNVTNSTAGDVPKAELITASPGIRVFAAIMTVVIIALGVLGNSLTVAALIKCPKIRNITAAFIISLCVADLSFSLLVMPFSVHRFISGGDDSSRDSAWCVVQPLIQYANVGVSLLSIAMITINRYIMIAHQALYRRVYTHQTVGAMVAFIWLFSLALLMPTLVGKWGKFGFDEKQQSCSIVEVDGKSSKTALFFLGFLIPCITIIVCYANIFWVVRRSENRMRQHSAAMGTEDGRTRGRTGSDWRVTKMVLAIFLAFVVCYLPITIMKIKDKNVSYPNIHVLSYVLIYTSSCINPIIYVIMNRQYRQAYKSVLCSKCPTRTHTHQDKSAAHAPARTVLSNVSLVPQSSVTASSVAISSPNSPKNHSSINEPCLV